MLTAKEMRWLDRLPSIGGREVKSPDHNTGMSKSVENSQNAWDYHVLKDIPKSRP